jgi:bifunctional non-homologous end joining protein LigD
MMACEELPRFIGPMLARTAPLPVAPDAPWVLEVKWDGVRAQIRAERGQLTLRTRPGRDATSEFPELEPLAEALRAHRLILDAELVHLDANGHPDFGAVAARLGRRHRAPADPAIVLQVFDVLHLDGHPVRTLPYQQRRELLEELGDELPSQVARVPRTFTIDESLVQATLDMGLEGVVAKRLDHSYRPGRRDGSWIKSKHRRRERMAIIGWRSRATGQELLVADLSGRPRGWCSFGLSGEIRQRIADDAQRHGRQHRGAWVTTVPLLMVDVFHHGRSGGRLRDPILRSIPTASGVEPVIQPSGEA